MADKEKVGLGLGLGLGLGAAHACCVEIRNTKTRTIIINLPIDFIRIVFGFSYNGIIQQFGLPVNKKNRTDPNRQSGLKSLKACADSSYQRTPAFKISLPNIL